MPMAEENTMLARVTRVLQSSPVTDLHTHLYPPEFGKLMLSGLDPLLTYHYLAAETLRVAAVSPKEFFAQSEARQADMVWQTLFIDRSPMSEAAMGVITSLQALGLRQGPSPEATLEPMRLAYALLNNAERMDLVFKVAGVRDVVMTNDPFNDKERPGWLKNVPRDPRFHAALRLDPLLNAWSETVPKLKALGFAVTRKFSAASAKEVRRYLKTWAQKTKALYMAVSLGPDFSYPSSEVQSAVLDQAVLPVCRELNLPLALMIGVKRKLNPQLGQAGDALGRAELDSVSALCARFEHNKFMLTLLSAENQHEAAVVTRKFKNLLLFGCWWFLNIPSQIESMTRMRIELLGTGFVPQHSDARVLEQLVYKWSHTRSVLAKVLAARYEELEAKGWRVEDKDVRRDAEAYLSGNFWNFLKLGL